MASITHRGRISQPIHDCRCKVVGEVRAGIFRKDKLFASKHMLQKPLAWALDVHSLKEAERAGADLVSLHDCETNKTYTASIDLIREKGIRINRGFGEQLALPLGYWRVDGREPQKQMLHKEPKPAAQQLALFEGVR